MPRHNPAITPLDGGDPLAPVVQDASEGIHNILAADLPTAEAEVPSNARPLFIDGVEVTRSPRAVQDMTPKTGVDPLIESEYADGWDGRLSKWELAHPILRGRSEVEPEAPVFRAAGTYVVFAASVSESGLILGPEAENLKILLGRGQFRGTPQFAGRVRAQALIDEERGVFRQDNDPDKVFGLHERTSEEVQAILARTLGAGEEDMQRREEMDSRRESDAPIGSQHAGAARGRLLHQQG